MVCPIQPTPIMEGKDAKRFLRNLAKDLNPQFTPEEREARKCKLEQMKRDYYRLVEATHEVFY
jgi:hypothetical protein